MKTNPFKRLRNNLSIKGFAGKGVAEKEIAEIEFKFGVSFPGVYRKFLLYSGETFPFSDYDISLNEAEKGERFIPSDFSLQRLPFQGEFWVFGHRQGENFLLFSLEGGEDPPVYVFNSAYKENGEYEVEMFAESISTCIDNEIELFVKGIT